jgi:hypothetical protein
MIWRLSHFFPTVYGLLFQHILRRSPSESILAELRPSVLDGHNLNLNGERSSLHIVMFDADGSPL